MQIEENSKTVQHVLAAAKALKLDIEVIRMPTSTRTAQDAAEACGCSLGQIVKSLIFQGEQSGNLALFLVSGAHPLSDTAAEEALGERPRRANAQLVRQKTGFAIGGVAPIGHLTPLPCFMDAHLLHFDTVWAAAGAPNAVFSLAPQRLCEAIGAKISPLGVPGYRGPDIH